MNRAGGGAKRGDYPLTAKAQLIFSIVYTRGPQQETFVTRGGGAKEVTAH